MKENPYSKLMEIIKKQNTKHDNVLIAEVISPPSNLIIKIGDLQVDKDNILIADYLLKEHTRASQSSSNKSNWSTTNYIKYVDTIEKGDKLAVLQTGDKQLYIIIARLREVL